MVTGVFEELPYTGGLKVEGPIIDGKDAAQLFLQLFVHQEMNLLEKN